MGDSAREKSRALFVFALPSYCYAMTEHDSPTSIMNEKPLSPAARAGLVVNAAFTILLFYLTAILFMAGFAARSEEHTSELQSPCNLVCRLLLEKKKKKKIQYNSVFRSSQLHDRNTKCSRCH